MQLSLCGECDNVEVHKAVVHTRPGRVVKDKVVKGILIGLIWVLMLVVMMDLPYAAYPGGSTPFLVMISTLILLSVITLLNL